MVLARVGDAAAASAGECGIERRGLGAVAAGVHRAHDSDEHHRCDGAQRDSADRGVLAVLRHGDGCARRACQDRARRARCRRAHHAQGDGLRHARRAACRVRRARGDDREGRHRHRLGLRLVHRRVLSRALDSLGGVDRARRFHRRSFAAAAHPADSRAGAARVLHRELRGGVSEDKSSSASARATGSRASCCRSATPSISTAR